MRTLEIMGRALGMFQRRKMIVETVYSLSQLPEAELEARMFELAERLGYRLVPVRQISADAAEASAARDAILTGDGAKISRADGVAP